MCACNLFCMACRMMLWVHCKVQGSQHVVSLIKALLAWRVHVCTAMCKACPTTSDIAAAVKSLCCDTAAFA
jgi:hypothetical protein